MISKFIVDETVNGGVNVAGAQARKSGWIQVKSLWQSTAVVVTVPVSTTGAGDGVVQP